MENENNDEDFQMNQFCHIYHFRLKKNKKLFLEFNCFSIKHFILLKLVK